MRVGAECGGSGVVCVEIGGLIGDIEHIAIDGGEHGVDDLFEVIVDVGLPLLSTCADAVLRE